jgi:predicted DNA-binding transcriptional regulator AlpA
MKKISDTPTAVTGDRRIRKPEVLKLTGYEDRTFYRRIAAGLFPKPEKDGRMSFWRLSQVQNFLGNNHGGNPA